MSYEHQARIRWSFTTHPANDMFGEEEPAALKELDHVYAQAAKADEYEAKAKAYDDIRYAMEMQTAIDVSDEDTLIEIDLVIMRLIERMEGGGSDD